MADLCSDLGGYGRTQVATDYVAGLLELEPGMRLSTALGGSRSPRAEAASNLVRKSPWQPSQISTKILRRVHTWLGPGEYVWSVQVTALRAHLEDDEPRFNMVVLTAASRKHGELLEVPAMVLLDESETWPSQETLVGQQLHALEHVRGLSPERRVVSFGAVVAGHRFLFHAGRWSYLQLFPSIEPPLPVSFVDEDGGATPLHELAARLPATTGGLELHGSVAWHDDVPDWPEWVYAYRHSDGSVDFRATNLNIYDPNLDPLLIVALGQSSIAGQLDLCGAGVYRGPTHSALWRHLALVCAATAFVMERVAIGCDWGEERYTLGLQRYMDRFLRETAATGRLISEGEDSAAREVLRGEHPRVSHRSRWEGRTESKVSAAGSALVEAHVALLDMRANVGLRTAEELGSYLGARSRELERHQAIIKEQLGEKPKLAQLFGDAVEQFKIAVEAIVQARGQNDTAVVQAMPKADSALHKYLDAARALDSRADADERRIVPLADPEHPQ